MLSWPGEHHRRWLPHILLFIVVLIWSGNTVISKLMIREVPPVEPQVEETPATKEPETEAES